MTAVVGPRPVMAFGDLPAHTVLRIANGIVVVVMTVYAIGVIASPEIGRALAVCWAAGALITGAAAVVSLARPGTRWSRTVVGIGVPVALAWRIYVVTWELITGTLPFGWGRALVILSVYALALASFPVAWAKVVIPLSESERYRLAHRP